MNKQSSGYILVLVLMIVALSVISVTYIIDKSTAFNPYIKQTVSIEKAQLLALSGVQVALSQLSYGDPQWEAQQKEAQKTTEAQKATAQTGVQQLLAMVLPHKNRWQTFTLQKKRDGLDGVLQICLMSEQGKLDINALYDFEKKKFVGDAATKKALQELFTIIEKETGGKDLFAAFEKFLKDRQYKLHDVTELLTINEFAAFKNNIFYDPPATTQQEKEEKRQLYLTDIFTVWSGKLQLEPWLLSDSVSALLGLNRAQAQKEGDEAKETINQLLKKFKQKAVWQVDWDSLLKPIYGKSFKELPPSISLLFSPAFEPTIFSVLSYGKVDKITQKILAIIERDPQPTKQGFHTVNIKRLFWL